MHLVLFQTATDWAAVALVLVAGLCFGFAMAPGGRKWREQFQAIESDFASYHVKAEEDLRVASRRIRDLEAENARLVRDAQAAAVATPAPMPVTAPVAAPAAEPVVAPLPPAEPVPVAVAAPAAIAEPVVQGPSAEEQHAAYVKERDKHDLRHSVEAALAGAVLGAVADRVADRADGHVDHGILHNIGAAALGAVAGVAGEKALDKIGDHNADKHEAEKEAREDGH